MTAARGLPQRCPEQKPHDPHPVPPRGDTTGFRCAGVKRGEFDRQLEQLGPAEICAQP